MIKNKLLNLFSANAKRGSFKAEDNTIYIYDMICGDELEAEYFGGVSPKGFIDALSTMTGTVHIRINSPGGDVFGGKAIAQAIREYKGEIIVHVDGLAASAASIIAIAAPKIIMAPGSMMMIHNAWTMAVGNADDLMETASLLAKIDRTLAEAYASRSNGSSATFAAMMSAVTWFTPQEALDAGLATEIAPEKVAAMAEWDLSVFNSAPKIEGQTTSEITVSFSVSAVTVKGLQETIDQQANEDEELENRQRQHALAMILRPA